MVPGNLDVLRLLVIVHTFWVLFFFFLLACTFLCIYWLDSTCCSRAKTNLFLIMDFVVCIRFLFSLTFVSFVSGKNKAETKIIAKLLDVTKLRVSVPWRDVPQHPIVLLPVKSCRFFKFYLQKVMQSSTDSFCF